MIISLLILILVVEASVAVCSVGAWIYHKSRCLDKWVHSQGMHYSYTHRQDFDENWAAFTMGYVFGAMMIAVGLLSLCVSLGVLIWG